MIQICEDCGNRMYSGTCSNCSEELYILENQSDCIEYPLSDDFLLAAAEQAEAKRRRVKSSVT